jgi:magnesium transporter
MRPLSGLRNVAPSTSLLKFLRSQQETVCFFSQSFHLDVTAPSHGAARSPKACLDLHSHAPSQKTWKETPRRATLQASYLDLLWPRHCESSPKALPPPPQNHLQHHYSASGIKQQSRRVSTDSHSFFQRLFAFRDLHYPWKNHQSDLPSGQNLEDPSSQLFNLSRSVSRSTSGADLKLRCTEFDANGSVTLVSGEFKKSELIAKYGLLPRDLRKIDSSVLPHILIRPSAILINLLHLRVLIQSDRVLVFDAYGSTDSYTQSLFMYDLEGKLRQKADARANGSGTYLPYEFRALEAVLISVTSGLESEFEGVREPVVRVLRELEEDIDRDKLRHLLIHSKKLGTFEQKARLVRDAINDLLDADDDLASMYLTERKALGKERDENDHQEVEMLLESYHKICDEIVEISGNLIGNIRNTEEVVKAILDANRNSLMLLELKFSIGTLGLAAGTLVAGLYGMNLKNFIEESGAAFSTVSMFCFGLSAMVAMYGMRKLRKVQKVRMWGEGYGSHWNSSRGNWRNEAMEHAGLGALPGESRLERIQRHRQERAPVLWPGMYGLGTDTPATRRPVTIHDKCVNTHNPVEKKVNARTTAPPVPTASPTRNVKKGS